MYFNTVTFLFLSGAINKIYGQFAQNCTCVVRNQCYQLPTGPTGNDGSGVIDIRIVNPGDLVTIPPTPQPTVSPGTCTAGLDLCCTGPGVVGCGLRTNIPVTPITTPGLGQMKYGNQPWQVLLLGIDNTFIGGGAILDQMNVITAAHKVVNRTITSIKVRAGDWDIARITEPYPTQEVLVTSIRIHSNFSNVTNPNLQNDVAILKLATPISFNTPNVNSICLPTATSVFDNQRCLVAGWGKDAFNGNLQTVPKEVEVPVVPYADCQTKLRATVRLGPSFTLDPISFICAGGEPGRDACTGDGGAALACAAGGRYQLAGLVAWGIGCADNNVPGVYVKISSFLPWIQTQLTS